MLLLSEQQLYLGSNGTLDCKMTGKSTSDNGKIMKQFPACFFFSFKGFYLINHAQAGPDPGFSVGGRGPILGGFWPPMWAFFSENVCENERFGSCRGACAGTPP